MTDWTFGTEPFTIEWFVPLTAAIIPFATRRAKCTGCGRWFVRDRLHTQDAYCSYHCGAKDQPDHCASSWGFTSVPGGQGK